MRQIEKLWRIFEWQLGGNADLFEIQKEFIRKMDAKLSEMTIKALLYRESRILQMGKFLKRKT